MTEEYISEIFLTSNHVEEEHWLDFFNAIAKLNGYFRRFDFYITTDLNEVRFFLVTKRLIPPILNDLGDFLIKRMDSFQQKNPISLPALIPFCLMTNKEKNVLDVYDRFESKKSQTLRMAKMSFWSYKKDHFFTRTTLYLQSGPKAILRRKKVLLAIPHFFFSINFSIYHRFFYRKNENHYLDIQKVLPVFQTDSLHALLKIDTFPYLSENFYLNQFSYDFQKHSIIIGSSGTGKSKLASSFIYQNCINPNEQLKAKVVVIDPHANLEKDIGGLPNSCVLDFKSPDHSANLFMQNAGHDSIASVELMLSLFKTLMQDQYNSKLERVLMHSIHLLETCQILNFSNLRKLLLDMDFRSSLINDKQKDLSDRIIHFFYTDFNELKSQSYQEAISPIIAFLDEMELLPVFQKKYQCAEIKDLINEHSLTIFSLDQSSLGEKVTKTISGLAMQQLWELVKSRHFADPILLVVDEVSVIENPILSRLLSEARKYNLHLVLIQQYFGQISESLQKSIFANVSNFYVFRVSKSDALLLENNLQMEVAVHNSYKVRLKLLTELKNRECIARISYNGVLLPAFKAQTLDFTPTPRKNQIQILRTDPLNLSISKETKMELTTSSFVIDESFDTLQDIMTSQSSSRKQVISHG